MRSFRRPAPRACTVADCPLPRASRNYCKIHTQDPSVSVDSVQKYDGALSPRGSLRAESREDLLESIRTSRLKGGESTPRSEVLSKSPKRPNGDDSSGDGEDREREKAGGSERVDDLFTPRRLTMKDRLLSSLIKAVSTDPQKPDSRAETPRVEPRPPAEPKRVTTQILDNARKLRSSTQRNPLISPPSASSRHQRQLRFGSSASLSPHAPRSRLSTFSRTSSQNGAQPNKAVEIGNDTDAADCWRLLLQRPNCDTREGLLRQPEVRCLLQYGVPQEVRASVWRILSGSAAARERFPRHYYARLCDSVAKFPTPFDAEIKKDVARSLPNHPRFQQDEGKQALARMLAVYSARNSESVGYCQSMNMIAAALLCLLDDEEEAFWLLCVLIDARVGYYSPSMSGIEVDHRVLSSLVSYAAPSLFDHLQKMLVEVQAFTVPWFLCLFMEAPLGLHEIAYFWDHLLVHGDTLLFEAALEIMLLKHREILNIKDEGEMLEFVLSSGMKEGLHARDIIANIYYNAQRAHCEERVQQIADLRMSFRTEVLRNSRRLISGTARRLMLQHGLISEAEVQQLWASFLEPNPWEILSTNCITSVLDFNQAFLRCAFSKEERSQWRDRGLISGLTRRLFEMVDIHCTGMISFDAFLDGVVGFTKSDHESRLILSFRFFDLDADGLVTREEFISVLAMLRAVYEGDPGADAQDRAFVDEHLEAQMQEISLEIFKECILDHTHTCKVFGLRKNGTHEIEC
jgi:hypothetical protein